MLQQQQDHHQEQLNAMGHIDASKREEIMATFEEDKERIQRAMEMERDRQNAHLEDLLHEKRQARRTKQQRKMDGILREQRKDTDQQIAIVNERASEATVTAGTFANLIGA